MKSTNFTQSSSSLLVQNVFFDQQVEDDGFDNYEIVKNKQKRLLVDKTNQQLSIKENCTKNTQKIQPLKNKFKSQTVTVSLGFFQNYQGGECSGEGRSVEVVNEDQECVERTQEIIEQQNDNVACSLKATNKEQLNIIKKSQNLCLNFDSSSQEQEQQQQLQNITQTKQSQGLKKITLNTNSLFTRLSQSNNQKVQDNSNQLVDGDKSSQNKENNFKKKQVLLMKFDDQDSQTQSQQENSQKAEISATVNIQKVENNPPQQKQKPNILLNTFSDSESQSQTQTQLNQTSHYPLTHESSQSITRPITILQLCNITHSDSFIYQPIPQNCVLQTIVKRYLPQDIIQNNNVIYQMFDSMTYKSILKVKKVSEGFQMFSSKQGGNMWSGNFRNIIAQKTREEMSCALVCSNFFGTEFNCYKFNRNNQKPNYQKLARLITVGYETNFLGLKGPRKMDIYIPRQNYVVKSEKGLHQIFDQQNKNKIQHFINRTPRWNSIICSFVLNFNGRATVSSVKNFIITSEEEQKNHTKYKSSAENNFVLFGKIDKNVFNLDVKYPFSLVQALTLALSSFDKKLGCQ